ncbi:mannose/fructose/sorbose PTS transporter subunit IIA [Clostridium sp. MB40-C1]|uniref:PTS sugar transporter subunit IIA n=1 Tax=Clostridium sp. MB40-C1 TaxID=3070996 RepID=UPI0027E0463F|nr:mannose/fructose/sorbose PTS transporter subunit IIA [Clostridium sp. MB40-C1]WMJ79307.1 mannose/fructose/sorbose PTS transporter subunit IIA [Clostridium sp. MB40-C1]
MKLIVCGHGDIAPGILNASNMIFGEQEGVFAVPFLNGEGTEDLKKKIEDVLAKSDDDNEVLFMIDVFGGTPYNIVAEHCYNKKNMDIITGVNLPLVLEALSLKNSVKLDEMVLLLSNSSKESFRVYSEEIKKVESDNVDDL